MFFDYLDVITHFLAAKSVEVDIIKCLPSNAAVFDLGIIKVMVMLDFQDVTCNGMEPDM